MYIKLKKSLRGKRRTICNKCYKAFDIVKIHESKYKQDGKPFRYLYFICPFCRTRYDIYNGPDKTITKGLKLNGENKQI